MNTFKATIALLLLAVSTTACIPNTFAPENEGPSSFRREPRCPTHGCNPEAPKSLRN